MSLPLPPWARIDSFRQPPHQRVVDRLNELHNISPPAGGEVLRTPFGSAVNTPPVLPPNPQPLIVFLNGPSTSAGLPTHSGGIYDGFYYTRKTYTGSVDTTNDPKCMVIVREEVDETWGSNSTDSHWFAWWGIGMFNGSYTSDATPLPIINATGFTPNNQIGYPNTNFFAGPQVVPNFAAQGWTRGAAYADPTNPANTIIGDIPPTLQVQLPNGHWRRLNFDATGRLVSIGAQDT